MDIKDYHIEFKKADSAAGRDQLVISGRLTVVHAEEIKYRIMQLVSTFSSSLDIIMKEVTDFDLSFLQLLQSFINLLALKSIDYTIRWLIDEEQEKLIVGSGFSKYL